GRQADMLELVALGPGEGSRGFPCLVLIHLPSDRGAAAIVIPVEILAGPAIGEPDFKAAGVGNAPERMWDDANAIRSALLPLPRCNLTGRRKVRGTFAQL